MNAERDGAGRRRALKRLAVAGAAWMATHANADVLRWTKAEGAPVFAALDLDGKPWRLEALRGRAVLLNFWASWCEPCRAEMPTLQQLADIYGPERLQVLALNFKETPARAAQFSRATGLSLPVLLDPDGEIARRFGVRIFPTTVLVGADGVPRQRVRGEMDWTGQEAERLVAGLLGPKKA